MNSRLVVLHELLKRRKDWRLSPRWLRIKIWKGKQTVKSSRFLSTANMHGICFSCLHPRLTLMWVASVGNTACAVVDFNYFPHLMRWIISGIFRFPCQFSSMSIFSLIFIHKATSFVFGVVHNDVRNKINSDLFSFKLSLFNAFFHFFPSERWHN